jgi:hypothetical protein
MWVGVSGDDNPPNAPCSKQGLTAFQNLQFRALTVAMQYVEVSCVAGLDEESYRRMLVMEGIRRQRFELAI